MRRFFIRERNVAEPIRGGVARQHPGELKQDRNRRGVVVGTGGAGRGVVVGSDDQVWLVGADKARTGGFNIRAYHPVGEVFHPDDTVAEAGEAVGDPVFGVFQPFRANGRVSLRAAEGFHMRPEVGFNFRFHGVVGLGGRSGGSLPRFRILFVVGAELRSARPETSEAAMARTHSRWRFLRRGPAITSRPSPLSWTTYPWC